MSTLKLHLLHHTEPYALASLPPDAHVTWDRAGSAIFAVSHTSTETSVLCHDGVIPAGVRKEGPFHVFEVAGPLSFSTTGVLAGIFSPVAERGIPLLSMSTYETDWILIPVAQANEAERIWKRVGFLVTPPVLGGST